MLTNQEHRTNPIRVLFVEDEEDYREIVGEELSWHGFAVRSYADGRSLLDSLGTDVDADVIVLDWRLPNVSGIDLLPQLRARGVNLPVVFLTCHALIALESQAFARGAVDFIDKTRGVEILARRLKLVVKAGKPAAHPQLDKGIVCGKLVLRPSVNRAYWNDVDVGLTCSQYDIVQLLATNVGRCVTYREIHDCMHHPGFVAGDGDYGYRVNVRSAMMRIRRKFREFDSTFDAIETYSASGYCWTRPARDEHFATSGASSTSNSTDLRQARLRGR